MRKSLQSYEAMMQQNVEDLWQVTQKQWEIFTNLISMLDNAE